MAVDWQSLIANLAVVALFISAWVHGQFMLATHTRELRNTALGVLLGLGAVASMLLAIEIEPGVLFDLRLSLMAIAGFFGGPIAAVLAVTIAATYRLLLGGSGAMMGLAGIALAAALGLVTSQIGRRAQWSAVVSAVVLAGAVGGLSLAVMAGALANARLGAVAFPTVVMNPLATLICALLIMRHRVVQRERDLLHAAFMQSPDLQYVKTPDCRIVAVNENLIRHYGVANAGALVGKTDADLLDDRERAQRLLAAERELLATGRDIEDSEEVLHDAEGAEQWFTTTKVRLHDGDGETIGLAGVTSDITVRKQLERELTESRNQLRYVLTEMSDGIAMFDGEGVLIYCNEQYRRLFPRTSERRVPGEHLRAILNKVVETREQVLPAGKEQEWVDEIVASLASESEEEVELFDGRWLHVRTRPTADGAALVVVSDVTKVKHAESALRSLTDQLKLLATTDGLTGLTNRRAFDAALEAELARCRREGTSLSLLLIDVDRFKAYNDLYGHQAGDAVLKTVGACLRRAVKRSTDVVARYGGEEFVAILPDTDDDGAFFIADAFRTSLKALGLPHSGSDKGVVTASVGLATLTELDAGINSTELVRRADEALYNAKGAGRDRVTGWRPHYEVRPMTGARA